MTNTQKDDVAASDQTADTSSQTQNDPAANDETIGDQGCEPAENPAADEADSGPRDPMEVLLEERDSLKDQLLRALADVENMRRRTERELETARKYAHTGFARDLVGAIDNLSRAISAAPAKDEAASAEAIDGLVTGLEMSWQEIQTTMERHGIRQISPKGEKFDYNLHQAMFEVPNAEVEPGTVIEVVQHGYVLHDRLLRPAMVGVAKAAEPQSTTDSGSKDG